MAASDDEERALRSAALQNAASILLARQRAERELLAAKEALDQKAGELAKALAQMGGMLAELQQQRESFRVTLASIGDGVITTDLDLRVTYLNPVAEGMTGWPNAEARGLPLAQVFRIIHEQTRQPADNPIIKALQDGVTVALANHTALLSRHGREIAIEDSAAPIRDAAGKLAGVVMVFHDVTERRREETARRKSEARLRVALQIAALGIWEFDLKSNAVSLDEPCQELLGRQGQAKLDFETFWSFGPPDEAKFRLQALRAVLSGQSERYEDEYRIGQGDRWIKVRARPMRDGEGAIVGMIGAVLDITDLVKARATTEERRLELERIVDERTASLQRAVAQMEEFSYSVSHDLRAPLRAMQGYAQIVIEDFGQEIGAEGIECLKRIVRAGNRMDRLTRDVLTYSKISQGDAALVSLPLDRIAVEIAEQYAPTQWREGAITIANPLLSVLGHEALLVQAISNLLANALKFVADGTAPRVHLRTERRDGGVRLWVEDNGIGISPNHRDHIWGMFEKISPDKYEGTGIGLAIVRKAAERMGGTAGFESEEKKGSRFWLQLQAG